MMATGAFLAMVGAVLAWWLASQGVMRSPWLEEGVITDLPDGGGAAPPSAAKIGLGIFLAIATCIFSLLASSYFMRMEGRDWQAPPVPGILWFNTIVLIASSVALHMAQRAAKRGGIARARAALLAGGACALVFIAGQFWAWRELTAQGYFLTSNPANSFFYLLTGMHVLHLAGGLVALARTSGAAWDVALDTSWRASSIGRLRENSELCAIYWHFLLIVWLALFAMLMGWTNELGVLCRAILA